MIAQPAKADWKNMYIKSFYASSYTAKTKSPTDKADDYSNICQGIPSNISGLTAACSNMAESSAV